MRENDATDAIKETARQIWSGERHGVQVCVWIEDNQQECERPGCAGNVVYMRGTRNTDASN
jgi:hypothetical protein